MRYERASGQGERVLVGGADGIGAKLARRQDEKGRGAPKHHSISNATKYGLSSGICTNRLDWIARFVDELRVGSVNVWEAPGYRSEASPFGGVKDSGLGMKEGVVEAIKLYNPGNSYRGPRGWRQPVV